MTSILTDSTITDVIYNPTMEEFLDDSIALSTENIFYDKKIKYTYEDFIKHRNPSNSVCLFDIFQEKIHSYYTPNKEIKIKEIKHNEVTIPRDIKIDNYGYCHHCKQRKPFKIMLKCNSCKNSNFNCDFPTKILTINNNTLLIKSNYLYNI